MEVTSVIALILGFISILGTVVSTVWFFGKLRWEVDSLKRENDQQERQLKEITDTLKTLREQGSVPTESLEKRLTKLEEKFDVFAAEINKAISQLLIEVKTLERSSHPRSRRSDK